MSEVTAIRAGNLEFARPRRHPKGPDKTTWPKAKKNEPQDPQRRNLLGAFLVGAGLLAAGAVARKILNEPQPGHPEQSVQSSPYKDWKRFINQPLPREVVIAIGDDLEKDKYPGFSEVGSLIKRLQTDPTELKKYLPLYTHPEIIRMQLTDLIKTQGALGTLQGEIDFTGIGVDVVDIATGNKQRTTLPKVIDMYNHAVYLDNTFDVAPDIAKKLIIVKEFSHLLYMEQHREFLKKAINKRFEIDSTAFPDWDIHLQQAALNDVRSLGIDFGEEYQNAYVDLDVAAHYHILPALGRAKDEGRLSPVDIKVLGVNIGILEAAKGAGLLRKSGENYIWKEGIGPFSQEWLNLARPLWKLPNS